MAKVVEPSLIEQFVSVTAASEDVARSLLEACNGNLELAIGMHMDSGPAQNENNENAASSQASGEDAVRAPIPQKHEVLVEEQKQYGFRRHRRKIHNSVFDGFRDFQAEINQQENGQAASTSCTSKHRRLEDLFRPPIDLLFKGSFHSARNAGAQQNRWLLVNVQNVQEFSCQALNRDVWSNHSVRGIINKSFLLWQVYHDSEEGKKFTQFYPVEQWPYIAIIDPRTGEKMTEWRKMDSMSFCDLVGDFLIRHPNPSGMTTPSPPPAKRRKTEDHIIDSSEDSQLQAAIAASVHETEVNSAKTKVKPEDVTKLVLESDSDDCGLSSDEELETFSGSDDESQNSRSPLKNSQSPKLEKQVAGLAHGNVIDKSNLPSQAKCKADSPDDTTYKDDSQSQLTKSITDSKQDTEDSAGSSESTSQPERQKDKWKDYLGSESDDKSTILLRFPDGKREQLGIPVTSQLRALTEFVAEKGFPAEQYELLTHYPRKNLSQMESTATLKTAGLFPQETVFVHER